MNSITHAHLCQGNFSPAGRRRRNWLSGVRWQWLQIPVKEGHTDVANSCARPFYAQMATEYSRKAETSRLLWTGYRHGTPPAWVTACPASALAGGPYRIDVLERLYGARSGSPASIGNITETMTTAGAGSRGIIFDSRGTEVGHVFNVVNQNGVVRFLDGQTGRAASLAGF